MNARIFILPARQKAEPRPSLSDEDCFAVAAALRALPGGWLAQRDEDADGAVSMTLIAAENEDAPAFIVRRDPSGYRLEASTTAGTIGCFGSLAGLMRAARRALEG